MEDECHRKKLIAKLSVETFLFGVIIMHFYSGLRYMFRPRERGFGIGVFFLIYAYMGMEVMERHKGFFRW